MIEVEENTDRAAKWMRYVALALALVWACVCTFNAAATALIAATPSQPGEWIAGFTLGGGLTIAVLLVVPWASVAVALTRQGIGAMMLVLAGLLSGPYGWLWFIGALPHTPAMDPGNQLPFLPCILLSFATPVPAVVAACLFLTSSWAARRAVRLRPNREHYEAAKRYHQTGENLRGVHLPHCDLAGINLSYSDLEGANLAEANLEQAILVEGNLPGADLRSANLSHANLEGSDFSNSNLVRATLQGANLAGADLSKSYLFLANLEDSCLESANLLGAYLGGANLQGARLAGATLDDTTVMPEGWEAIVASKPEDEPS